MPKSTPVDEEELSPVVLNLRALKGSQSENAFAARCGVNQTTINRVLSGKQDVSYTMLAKIAKNLKMEPWQLVHPEGGKAVLKQLPDEIAEIAAQLQRIAGTMHGRIAIAQCAAAAFAEVEEPPAETQADPEAPAPAHQAIPRAKARGV